MVKAVLVSEIQIRDPFILPVPEDGRYYLYGTTDINCWEDEATGFDVYTSTDLINWDGPHPAFRPLPGFWATKNYWAPEVHFYKGRYFMFATFKANGVCRGTQILVADNPLGPFIPHSDGPVTPKSWECLDGTLYVASDGTPWIVFCHEWLQVSDGEMCALPLANDLSHGIGPPALLFRASEAPWAKSNQGTQNFVTDGPFLYTTETGKLLMLWSSFGERGYALGLARSESGDVCGPWIQSNEPLYSKDGGHGMLLRTFGGDLMLTLHAPNETPNERPVFIPIREFNGTLIID